MSYSKNSTIKFITHTSELYSYAFLLYNLQMNRFYRFQKICLDISEGLLLLRMKIIS